MATALGFSSYILWAEKGMTNLPFVRGSAFLLEYRAKNAFYTRHIITAGHVAVPVRYKGLYGDTPAMQSLGERHVSSKLLVPGPADRGHKVVYDLNVRFKVATFGQTDVAVCTFKNEAEYYAAPEELQPQLRPLKVDPSPLGKGEDLLLCGVDVLNDTNAPHDGFMSLVPTSMPCRTEAVVVSREYGTVLVVSTEKELPLSMCGAAVIRPSTGGVVGVVCAKASRVPPPPVAGGRAQLYLDPWLDLSPFPAAVGTTTGSFSAAFVPLSEFYKKMISEEM